MKTGDLPTGPYEDFFVFAQDASCDFVLAAFSVDGKNEYGKMMAIALADGPVYITREQARVFFDFKE